MTEKSTHRVLRKDFWVEETYSGTKYRNRTITLVSFLFFLLAVLCYLLLIFIEGFNRGPEIILAVAYTIGVLLITLIGLVVIISLIEYLRSFEK